MNDATFDNGGGCHRDEEVIAVPKGPGRSGRVLGHYRLDKLLGLGGMGEVYRAQDLALGRVVAVKLLRREVDDHLRARLRKESEASARIEHPAVATFYEHGQDGGQDFLAMEYVEGEVLRDVLQRGRLPGEQALEQTCVLLEGLVHAHAKGIVHRDIKPENIIITPDGIPKLLDFGIAKDIYMPESSIGTLATASMLTELTAHGAIIGTIGYMSPEQLRGEIVGEQTDVFAMGAVLYEMLTGEQAFPGTTPHERMAATFSRDIPSLDLREVHPDINAVLRCALARACKDRYPTAAAFLRDLRDLGTGIGLATLPNTLAIIDLVNLTGVHAEDWIGSGVAESLGVDLARLTGIDLVPRNKILRMTGGQDRKDAEQDPVALGLALGCRWVLTGTFQRIGPRLRLTVRFVEVATSRDLWVEKLDGETDSLFEMQDRLAELTAKSLDVVLPQKGSRRPDLSVQELYARGRKVMLAGKNVETDFATSQFERAVELDPDFAPALAGLAALQAPQRWVATADPEALRKGEELARRAISADHEFAESHVWLGYSLWRQGRVLEAERSLRTAAELDPTDHLAPYFMGVLKCELGDMESAVESLQRSHENDNKAVYVLNILGYAHAELGHYNEAEWVLGRAMDLVRGGGVLHWGATMLLLSLCYLLQGRLQDAWNACREMLDSIEGVDHAYRSGTRLSGLALLAEIALAREDIAAAEVAVNQALAMAEAQPTGPAKGHIVVNLLALKSVIDSDRQLYEAAKRLENKRKGYDFSWGPNNSENKSCYQLAKAGRHHGELAEAREFFRRAKALGHRFDLDSQ